MIPARRPTAFTLVELLVSITVIAVLIGLILPALAGGREMGRRTGCLMGLHQFGIAFAGYLEDHQRVLPFADRTVDVRVGWLAPLPSLEAYLSVPPPSLGPEGETRTSAPFVCPSDQERGRTEGFSYGYQPAIYMQLSTDRDRQLAISRQFERHPEWLLMNDLGSWHARKPRPAPEDIYAKNVLLYDGTAERGQKKHLRK